MATNKLTIYLIKEEFKSEILILKKYGHKIEISENKNFYTEKSSTKPPAWLNSFFKTSLGDNLNLFVSTARGVLIVRIKYKNAERYFALCFGIGHHMLEKSVIEERFGLRVTLNSVNHENLRGIEKRSIGAVSKVSREQMSKASKASDFGIDIEQDLVKAVTGASKSNSKAFGKTVTGADALLVSVPCDINSIDAFLYACFEKYLSTDYQENFNWIDQIQEIRNKTIVGDLNKKLIANFNERNFERLWMAIPELVDWNEIKGFKYIPYQKESYDDIYIERFRTSFRENIVDVKQIKSKYVSSISASSGDEINSWPAFQCLYGEFSIKDKEYVLNNGKWYEVNGGFVKNVTETYNEIPISTVNLAQYDHSNEGEYNLDVTESNPDDYILMDKKEIMHGGGSNKIEFCDIYSKDKQLIHIKHYGASSILSHLFMQGLNSGEYFVADSEFRKKLNDKLPTGWKLQNPYSKIRAEEYEIIFAIISSKPGDRPNIPFFSKVSVRNVKRRLESFGFKVSLKKIHSISSN